VASPLVIQFGFATWQRPIEETSANAGLIQNIEIVGSIDVSRSLPVDIPVMLVHGWIQERGDYEFTYRLFDPDGNRLPEPIEVPPMKATLWKEKSLYISYHYCEIRVETWGRYEIEAVCNGEVALRYPLWVSERYDLPR
jgi:hypothetical protein